MIEGTSSKTRFLSSLSKPFIADRPRIREHTPILMPKVDASDINLARGPYFLDFKNPSANLKVSLLMDDTILHGINSVALFAKRIVMSYDDNGNFVFLYKFFK